LAKAEFELIAMSKAPRGLSDFAIDTSMSEKEVSDLLGRAAKVGATDIHLTVNNRTNQGEVQFRVLGEIIDVEQVEGGRLETLMRTIFQSFSTNSEAVFTPTKYQDSQIADPKRLPQGIHGVRSNSGPHAYGIYTSLRLLYDSTEEVEGDFVNTMFKLGFEPEHILAMAHMRTKPTGLNVLSGPTGSGKSTTLKHMLQTIKTDYPGYRILTVEDPPEYPIRGATQLPVRTENFSEGNGHGMSPFASVIRNTLRMDPDVLMIGEVRDADSAHEAVVGAMTGHKVWTTMHTNDAMNIVTRLIDLLSKGSDYGDPLSLLADRTVLSGMISQRLVRVLCPECKISIKSDKKHVRAGVLERLDKVLKTWGKGGLADHEDSIMLKGPGCAHCKNLGIVGRSVVAEVVDVDQALLNALIEKGVEAARKYWLTRQFDKGASKDAVSWERTYVGHALKKILRGEVSPEEAEVVVGPLTSVIAHQDDQIEDLEYADLLPAIYEQIFALRS
jgi:type II secretory ATPase GspE/PulE/Tfp pilus assembly ATPase PilB-like protein